MVTGPCGILHKLTHGSSVEKGFKALTNDSPTHLDHRMPGGLTRLQSVYRDQNKLILNFICPLFRSSVHGGRINSTFMVCCNNPHLFVLCFFITSFAHSHLVMIVRSLVFLLNIIFCTFITYLYHIYNCKL